MLLLLRVYIVHRMPYPTLAVFDPYGGVPDPTQLTHIPSRIVIMINNTR